MEAGPPKSLTDTEGRIPADSTAPPSKEKGEIRKRRCVECLTKITSENFARVWGGMANLFEPEILCLGFGELFVVMEVIIVKVMIDCWHSFLALHTAAGSIRKQQAWSCSRLVGICS